MLAHRPDPDHASAQIGLIGVPWMITSQEPSAVPNGGFTFTVESRCVIAAAARTRRVAACLQLRGIKDARN